MKTADRSRTGDSWYHMRYQVSRHRNDCVFVGVWMQMTRVFHLRQHRSLVVIVTLADSTVEGGNPWQVLCSHQRDGEL